MSNRAGVNKQRLGEVLVQSGLIDERQLAEALGSGLRRDGFKERLGQTLVRLGIVTERDIAQALSTQLGLEHRSGHTLNPDLDVLALVPPAQAKRSSLLPVAIEDGVLVVACADPTDVVAIDDLRLTTGIRDLRTVVVPASELEDALSRCYGFDRRTDELIGSLTDAGEDDDDTPVAIEELDSGPMVRLVEEILTEAVERRASDVHVEPSRRGAVVRLRIDGVLQEQMVVPPSVMRQLTARLKLMGSMDIAERRLPQDGRARFQRGRTDVDLRISSLPSLHGETVVVRLLSKGAQRLDLTDVGMSERQLGLLLRALERPQGLVLITGPTGSGKTSTLYGALERVADSTRNVITLEDPVEYELPGVNQTQVMESIGRTFARCLRTVLRQDPDVIMVGEIRDAETAELALQASMTGHLVLSTLHTNDAPSAIARLHDLGVPSYLISSSLSLVVAQRLVRRVCQRCAVPTAATQREMTLLRLVPWELDGARLVTGAGCPACNHTGYRGRVGLFEMLPVTARLRDLVTEGASEGALRAAARERGFVGLREDGLAKAFAGTTTLEEVLRVAAADDDDVEGPAATSEQTGRDLRSEAATTTMA